MNDINFLIERAHHNTLKFFLPKHMIVKFNIFRTEEEILKLPEKGMKRTGDKKE